MIHDHTPYGQCPYCGGNLTTDHKCKSLTTDTQTDWPRLCRKMLEYGLQHKAGCDARMISPGPCTCGLDALIAEAEAALEEVEND